MTTIQSIFLIPGLSTTGHFTRSVRKVSDLRPGKRNWLTWSVGHL